MCDEHPDILVKNVWVTIGFTYNTDQQKYCLIKYEDGLCLMCAHSLHPEINAFCYECRAPRPVDWSTDNKSLDSLIMESWSNVNYIYDAYIQWIEYSLLINVREMASLSSHHGCTHIAEWLDPIINESIRVTLKQIGDTQLLDSHQVSYLVM